MATASQPSTARGVTAWPLWRLPPSLRCHVLAVIGAGATATGTAAACTPWRASDAALYVALLAYGLITIESARRMGDHAGGNKDTQGVWQIAAALLLPPFYAFAAPVLAFALLQWRVRRTLTYRRVFSAATVSLATGAASVAFHATGQPGRLFSSTQAALWWVLIALACAALRWIINNALVLTAVRLDDPATQIRDVLGGAEGAWNDTAEGCVGVLIAAAAAITPALLAVSLPCGMLLQRSTRHAQLVHASRTDPKTGLLTGPAWHAEATVQAAHATRDGVLLAVVMIDIDHFKQVNDTHGHLAGDTVLASVAATLTSSLRPGDLAARFGGEEFVLLLPGAGAPEAVQIAERLRARLAQITIPAPSRDGDPPRITVSAGVATLSEGISSPDDLVAAADAALYQAKRSGRNRVCLAGRAGRARG